MSRNAKAVQIVQPEETGKVISLGARKLKECLKKHGTLRAEIFAIIKPCQTVHEAKAIFAQAESELAYEEGVDTIAEYCKKTGISLASYLDIKRNLLKAMVHGREDMEKWIEWDSQHGGEKGKKLSPGFLKPGSSEYSGPNGARNFFRHADEARLARSNLRTVEAKAKEAQEDPGAAELRIKQQEIREGSYDMPDAEACVKVLNLMEKLKKSKSKTEKAK